MGEYEDRQSIREQRQGLLDKIAGDSTDKTAILPSENGGEPEAGRNDGSEAGGVAPVGGVIDLESARQQYKGLTGQVASAKWSADDIADKIAKWRLENHRVVGEGAGGTQSGPLTTEDEKKAAELLAAEAENREEAEKNAEAESKKNADEAARKAADEAAAKKK